MVKNVRFETVLEGSALPPEELESSEGLGASGEPLLLLHADGGGWQGGGQGGVRRRGRGAKVLLRLQVVFHGGVHVSSVFFGLFGVFFPIHHPDDWLRSHFVKKVLDGIHRMALEDRRMTDDESNHHRKEIKAYLWPLSRLKGL